MDNYIILILSGTTLLVAGVIVALRVHYRGIITEKERGILHHIHEQDRMAKEMEYVNVEKKVLEQMVKSKFDAMVMVSGSGFRVSEGEGDKGDKSDKGDKAVGATLAVARIDKIDKGG